MTPSFARCARAAGAVGVFGWLVACGGAADPGLFSAGSSAGSSNQSGGSPAAGAAPHGGAAPGGAPSLGGNNAAGEASTEGGATSGGSSAAGASSAGASGAAQAGASGAAQAGAGGAAKAGASSAGASAAGSAGASAGASNGGSAGSDANAGAGGREAETCETLFARANKELAAAQACNLAMNAPSCTGTVPNLCQCEVPVARQDSAETKAYRATLEQLDQKKCVQACAALVCLPATHAMCKATAPGSTTATCTSSYAVAF